MQNLINKLAHEPEQITFKEVIDVIEKHYDYVASDFSNGTLHNDKGTNEGSCKIFYFAKLNNLSEQQTLACFGDYYRKDVLQNTQGNDHGNIRNFMKTGWAGITFDSIPLIVK